MCYAIPGRLVDIQDQIGIVDYYGEKRRVLIDNDNLEIGDYVYAQGGVLISKVPKAEALKILDHWKDVFFKLKETDSKLSEIHSTSKDPNILQILQKINKNQKPTKEDMLEILKLNKPEDLKVLYELANNIRQKNNDNACCVHGIIEFSNCCNKDCHYCGIRRSANIKRYRLSVNDIIKAAENAVNLGFKALVLQSGDDPWYDEEKLVKIVKAIRSMGVLVFLSIGDRSKKLYKNLYDAGARAVLIRFETSNEELFERFRPGTSLKERLDLIEYVNKLGYVVATGFLVGLPGETNEDVINNILLTSSLKPEMFSFGPFIPTNDTPLENSKTVEKELILKITALSRFVDPSSKILATTALETLEKNAKKDSLMAGANSLMITATPKKYKKLYKIYSNKAESGEDISETIQSTLDILQSIGRAPTDIGIKNG